MSEGAPTSAVGANPFRTVIVGDELRVVVPPYWRWSYLLLLGFAGALFCGTGALVWGLAIREWIRSGFRGELWIGFVVGTLAGGLGLWIMHTLALQLAQTSRVELDAREIRVRVRGVFQTRSAQVPLSMGPKIRVGPVRPLLKPHTGGSVASAVTGLILESERQRVWFAQQLQGDSAIELARVLFEQAPRLQSSEDAEHFDDPQPGAASRAGTKT